jgi:outer membrane protease
MRVERRIKVGESDSGEDIVDWSEIIASVDADIQADDSKLEVYAAGQTALSYKKIFCDIIDVLENDKITDLSDDSTYKVTSVNKHKTLPHMELESLSGVY